jgi:glutaminyl-tRNA synthetase
VYWAAHAQVTYSSDYFQQLYDFAIQLIRSGNAYVDHQTADEIKAYRRAAPLPCGPSASSECLP